MTLSILGIIKKAFRNQIRKTVIVYSLLSIFSIIFNKIYAIFGHGKHSPYMTLMFLFPLLGGALFYLLLWLGFPYFVMCKPYRLFYNLYNSGIGALTLGSLQRGIYDIAGTSSIYVYVFWAIGMAFIVSALIVLLIWIVSNGKMAFQRMLHES